MNSSELKKSRRSLLMVLAAFVIPVVLAKLALDQQWFTYGVTNQGTLLETEITLDDMAIKAAELEKKWLVMYVMPNHCEQLCEQTLHSVNNTYIALGKEMKRVKAVALTHRALSAAQLTQIHENYWSIQTITPQTLSLFNKPQVLVVDSLGNVVLSYTIPASEEKLPTFGKAILSDMKKLLKYSRIG